jgi:hypothetical protein
MVWTGQGHRMWPRRPPAELLLTQPQRPFCGKPQGPAWIGKDFWLDRTPRAPAAGDTPGSSSSASRRGHWHAILHGEKRQRRRMQWFKPVYVGIS